MAKHHWALILGIAIGIVLARMDVLGAGGGGKRGG